MDMRSLVFGALITS